MPANRNDGLRTDGLGLYGPGAGRSTFFGRTSHLASECQWNWTYLQRSSGTLSAVSWHSWPVGTLVIAACGRFSSMSCVYHRLRHRWLRGLTRKPFLGGLRPPRHPKWWAAVAASESRGPTVIALMTFGRPLSRPPKASVWGHVQDQPTSTCLVRMIWVKDQHAQHWPWTLSK